MEFADLTQNIWFGFDPFEVRLISVKQISIQTLSEFPFVSIAAASLMAFHFPSLFVFPAGLMSSLIPFVPPLLQLYFGICCSLLHTPRFTAAVLACLWRVKQVVASFLAFSGM